MLSYKVGFWHPHQAKCYSTKLGSGIHIRPNAILKIHQVFQVVGGLNWHITILVEGLAWFPSGQQYKGGSVHRFTDSRSNQS